MMIIGIPATAIRKGDKLAGGEVVTHAEAFWNGIGRKNVRLTTAAGTKTLTGTTSVIIEVRATD